MMERLPRYRSVLSLLLLGACESSTAPPVDPTAGLPVYDTYCAACHGGDGRGSPMGLGPTLAGLRREWNEDTLTQYLADPEAFAAGVERLGQRPMPAFDPTLDPGQRRALVAYTLSLMD